MNQTSFKEIYDKGLAKDAILHFHEPFINDYMVLHILLKKYGKDFKTFLEIGTNVGTGTKIIKNAVGRKCEVLSLDLPSSQSDLSKQHPISEGKGDVVGGKCDLPFTQITGDSLKYDYSKHYPIDGWYIDGEHDFEHARHETLEAIKSKAELIVWHDADMEEVYSGIRDATISNKDYMIYRVVDTRIAYAIRTKK